ncbi:unnamed protein product [Vitrella brassicaformis CCMP3155]|uniref:AP2/ERF domain-containing protein n=1 Tax=Vitrella brassicaformis (strain CCMP3155) TaxID=1169540 RepID=A0A0G4GS27_VITBC|nr:unnamed protein product [Vitrella brassicaformis CCMP3155]|eukprot:CEM33430.1 unnamed protein product [Vitrella brassicaformis CCMP3155]
MWSASRMGNKTSSDSKSADEGKGKDKKGASASSSLEVASTIGAASTRAPTGTCAGSGDDNMTHVAGATEMSGSVSEMMPLNDRRERNRQGRQDRGGRVGGDPSDDEGGSSDDDSNDDESSSGDYDDENDEDYDPPDEDDDDDDYESSGSGGDHLSDSTYKQPKATGKAAVRAAVRATPVHQSTVQGVFFDEQRRFWTAQVRVNGKWKSRSFGVRKYGGRDEARRAAEECRLQNEQDNEKAGRPIKSYKKSEITGVYRDDERGRWVASWYESSKQKLEYFSVAKLGEEGAKQAAIRRREMMEKIWPDQRIAAITVDRKNQKLIDQLAAKVKGVYFDKAHNALEAYWNEGGKTCTKGFAINKHGIKGAYDKAVAVRKAKEASGAASLKQPAERQSGHRGVRWDKRRKRWVAYWPNPSCKQQTRCFPLSEYGSDSAALDAAIRCREKMVEQTKREKQDKLMSSSKRPSDAIYGSSVRRKVK